MKNKKAYFFTIDGLIALGIIVIGFVLIYASFLIKPPELQAEFFSEDILDILDNTKISNLSSTKFMDIYGISGIEENNTILQQVAYFCSNSRKSDATKIIKTATIDGRLISPNYGFELNLMDEHGTDQCNNPIYNRGNITTANPELVITSKNIIYFRDGSNLIGPWIAEVNVWL